MDPVDAESLEWMRRQLDVPQAIYSISELALLSGTDARRVRRFLLNKEIIKKNDGVRGKHNLVPVTEVIERIPEFWKSIVFHVRKRTVAEA